MIAQFLYALDGVLVPRGHLEALISHALKNPAVEEGNDGKKYTYTHPALNPALFAFARHRTADVLKRLEELSAHSDAGTRSAAWRAIAHWHGIANPYGAVHGYDGHETYPLRAEALWTEPQRQYILANEAISLLDDDGVWGLFGEHPGKARAFAQSLCATGCLAHAAFVERGCDRLNIPPLGTPLPKDFKAKLDDNTAESLDGELGKIQEETYILLFKYVLAHKDHFRSPVPNADAAAKGGAAQ
jgi:hypothetical protein